MIACRTTDDPFARTGGCLNGSMAPNHQPAPDGVTTTLTDTTASATAVVAAPPEAVFDFVRSPANHGEISGDESVRGRVSGPELLEAESSFRMKMRRGPIAYRMTNKVVEFDRNRVIAWSHLGGHRWRWEIEPDGSGGTRVTETYDQSTARIPLVVKLMGYPKGHVANVAKSVANVVKHFGGGA
jgi:hypothetical protein